MTDLEALSKRIERLEDSQPKRWSTIAQQLLSPLILLIIGWWLNGQLEESKQILQRSELDLRRISAVQGMLEQLFSGKPEQAFVTERLMKRIVEQELADEISRVVAQYYRGELERLGQGQERISEAQVAAMQEITEPAKRLGADSALEIAKAADAQRAFVVGKSIAIDSPDGRALAIAEAERLRAKGYDSAVWSSRTGYYGIVAGHLPIEKALALKGRAVAAGDVEPDAYLHSGGRFIEQVWP